MPTTYYSGGACRTPVLFRVHDGEVVALFPELPHSPTGYDCVAYAHEGQHHGADYSQVVANSRPATVGEYAPLLQELRNVGYIPYVVARASRAMHDARARAAAYWQALTDADRRYNK